jgi:hypothetical protein
VFSISEKTGPTDMTAANGHDDLVTAGPHWLRITLAG